MEVHPYSNPSIRPMLISDLKQAAMQRVYNKYILFKDSDKLSPVDHKANFKRHQSRHLNTLVLVPNQKEFHEDDYRTE